MNPNFFLGVIQYVPNSFSGLPISLITNTDPTLNPSIPLSIQNVISLSYKMSLVYNYSKGTAGILIERSELTSKTSSFKFPTKILPLNLISNFHTANSKTLSKFEELEKQAGALLYIWIKSSLHPRLAGTHNAGIVAMLIAAKKLF